MGEKKTLEEGEIICPKCEGKGNLNAYGTTKSIYKICPKCFGVGKLDWIEAIIGKVRRKLKAKWKIDISKDLQAFYSKDVQKEIMDALSAQLARDVDKEILEDLLKGSNKMKNTSFSIHKEK